MSKHRQYLHAITAYQKSENYDALLRVIQEDAGILLASLEPSQVLEMLDQCPEETLKANPFAILVLMRRMFTWRQIPKMMELKVLLLAAIEAHLELSPEERGNLLGECDLMMSLLCYNDIRAMSRLHRSASSQMSRPAISIRNSGGWTFGSPSVLMMFHRVPGELPEELAEMDECMPHYYKITGNHGQGALCCDFLARRLSLFTNVEQRCSLEERYAALLRHHDMAWINLWSATAAYYHALRGEVGNIPEIFAEHRLASVSILAPGKPMMEMIENQVYLAQGAYAKAAGRSGELLALCGELHYALVALHVRIQTAAAYAMLGKTPEARTLLAQALGDAAPDGFVLPFAENYGYLKPLLAQMEPDGFLQRITEPGESALRRRDASARPPALSALTEREFEIVTLMEQRLSNREIAEKLFLSEGSVKQYVKQIYSKLHIADKRSACPDDTVTWDGDKNRICMICHANRPKSFRASDGFRNVLIAARFAVGNLPQRRPDCFLKRCSVQPVRKIKCFARPCKIFVQLPEYQTSQLVRRVGFCVPIIVFIQRSVIDLHSG